jgi:hypothetical protein
MCSVFKKLVGAIWLMDFFDFPQVEFLDTTLPINGVSWFLIFLLLPKADWEE